MSVVLTSGQSNVMNVVESTLDDAYRNGITGSGLSPLIAALTSYNDDNIMGQGDSLLANALRKVVKDYVKAAVASLISVMNVNNSFPSSRFTGTVALAKLTGGGTIGSLTLADGFVTAYTPPT